MNGKTRLGCLPRLLTSPRAVVCSPISILVVFGTLLAVSVIWASQSQASATPEGCYAEAAPSGDTVGFSVLPDGAGNSASLTLGDGERPALLTQSPACAPSVIVGHSYAASLHYTSTSSALRLEVLVHSEGAWHVWYTAPGSYPARKSSQSISVELNPIQGEVDQVAFGLLLSAPGTVDVSGLSLVDSLVHTPAVAAPAASPVSSKGSFDSASPFTQPLGSAPLSAAAAAGTKVRPNPKKEGQWTVFEGTAGARSIHAVLLQNGKILVMAGSGNDRMEFEKGTFKSFLYDPVTNAWQSIPTPWDVFCAGHVQLANGNVLILGGTKAYPPAAKPGEYPSTVFEGTNMSWIFNIHTDQYEEVPYNKLEPNNPGEPGPLLSGAWYPSATELGNGDVISFGGLNESGQGNTKVDYYTGPGNAGTNGDKSEAWVGYGSSKVQQTYPWYWGEYPTMILTADGRLFYGGSHVFGNGIEGTEEAPSGSSLYDFYCSPGENPNAPNPNAEVEGPNGTFKRVTDTPGLREPNLRDQSTELLLPPAQSQKVMIMGGGNTYTTLQNTEKNAIDLTDEINLSKPNPQWEAGPNLPRGTMENGSMEPEGAGKMYVSAVALPNGTVMETGGSLHVRGDNVHEASIFNPETNAFTSVAADPVGRNYHSEALLLPDGRVLTLGSNPVNPETGVESFETRISIYQPPYLFNGVRPVLDLIDGEANSMEGGEDGVTKTTQWEYGTEHVLSYTSKAKVTSAVLIRPAAVTHSSDPNQREVALAVVKNKVGKKGAPGELTVGLTPNSDLAPPGYYMIFLVNAKGVPSVAQWVHVGPQGSPTP